MDDTLCLAVALALEADFPCISEKLQSVTFADLNFRLFRMKIDRSKVLQQLTALCSGVFSTSQVLAAVFHSDPVDRVFSEAPLRTATIALLTGKQYLYTVG